jgi:UDP-N-acetylglucosamine acyltransferase
MVSQDVLPYTLVVGDRARTFGLNSVGLRRNGFPDALRRDLGRAVRLLLGAPSLAEGLERARGEVHPSDAVLTLIAFVEQSRRGICRGAVVRAPVTGSEEA